MNSPKVGGHFCLSSACTPRSKSSRVSTPNFCAQYCLSPAESTPLHMSANLEPYAKAILLNNAFTHLSGNLPSGQLGDDVDNVWVVIGHTSCQCGDGVAANLVFGRAEMSRRCA